MKKKKNKHTEQTRKLILELSMLVYICSHSIWKLRWEDHEFEASLIYIATLNLNTNIGQKSECKHFPWGGEKKELNGYRVVLVTLLLL